MPHTYTAPLIGLGTTLGYSTTGPSAYATAAWVKTFDADFGSKMLEWTNLAQVSQRRLPIKFDGGEPTFGMQWLPGETANIALQTVLTTQPTPLVYWLLTLPDTSTVKFAGYLSKMGPSIDSEEEIDVDCTISIDGVIVITPVAS